MTALAAGVAMFPMAISPPPATEQFRNIATGISGGLVTSTLMTLIVIPVAYLLMDDVIQFFRRAYLADPTEDAEERATDVAMSADRPVDEISRTEPEKENEPFDNSSGTRAVE